MPDLICENAVFEEKQSLDIPICKPRGLSRLLKASQIDQIDQNADPITNPKKGKTLGRTS